MCGRRRLEGGRGLSASEIAAVWRGRLCVGLLNVAAPQSGGHGFVSTLTVSLAGRCDLF
ncbi:MAG TPA: hypothetical protein VM866_00595 [Pyrinomonadaceae bacterium]|nr:hypothetical protein [Pyrinomonadaceae bacterium]